MTDCPQAQSQFLTFLSGGEFQNAVAAGWANIEVNADRVKWCGWLNKPRPEGFHAKPWRSSAVW
jgi:hypothetical protein